MKKQMNITSILFYFLNKINYLLSAVLYRITQPSDLNLSFTNYTINSNNIFNF